MSLQRFFAAKTFVALVARVRRLAGVFPFVIDLASLRRVFLLAETAPEALFLGVRPKVRLALSFLAKSLVAHGANVRLLSGVRHLVRQPSVLRHETLLAETAFVRFFLEVFVSHVHLQRFVTFEIRIALFAFVRF